MRYAVKGVVVWVMHLLTWPFSLTSLFMYKVFSSEGAFAFSAQLLSLVPGKPGQYLRASFYCVTLEQCKYDLMVGFCSYFSHPTARVGRGVGTGSFTVVGTATIDDSVLISSRVSILSGKFQHGQGISQNEQNKGAVTDRVNYTRVHIGARSWIGEGAIVMASIGADTIVSAGSVVTKDMPDNMTAIGNPARFLNREI
jgi:acetyltransferase-like isoleucine patch superfamily enzyme